MKRKQWMAVLILGILSGASLPAAERVLLRGGTPVHVRLKGDIDSTRAAMGDRVDMELARPLTVGALVVAPEGAVAWGVVQVVNKGKSVRFDVQGVRLPSLVVVKLRSIPEKTGNPTKEVVKVDQSLVPRGSEFVAYIDDDVSLDIAAPAAAPVVRPATTTPAVPPAEPAKPATTPAPAPAPAAPPAEVKPAEPAPPPVPAPETSTPAPAPTVAVPAAPAQAVPPAAPTETPRPASTPAAATPVKPAEPTPATVPPEPVKPAPTPVVVAPAAPVHPAPAVPAPAPGPTGMEGVTDWVTVECFSVPSGADILIDGDFYGNTPSILRLPVGKHRLRFILTDYAASSQELELTSGAALRTVRVELEKKEQ